ncbi:MAG: efflux RND transporter periplasmic adaptor subunit [Phycisphaerales bacterium]|nr:MAG: efflux RND transporter periplasmic adaptor subunit [Phycisphaerales bacterium]
MKVFRRVVYWIVVLAVVSATFWFAYMPRSGEDVVEDKVVPVEVEEVAAGSITETIELTGWIRASQVVDVTSKVAGRIESLRAVSDTGNSVAVEEGLIVRKGQQLAVIDHQVYLAQLAAAQASVRARQVELADAEREKKRILALYESGSITEQNRDRAITAADLAAASLSLAKANLELAQISLRESTIVSPIDGIVTAKHIDEGNMVALGQRIVAVADMKTVKIVAAVAERYGSRVAVGMPVRIRVDAFENREFEAQVYSVHPALDEHTHTMQVEIRLGNDESLLKPGMFARVTLITNRKDAVVVVPRDIVLGGKIDKHYVYVIEDGAARKRFVEIGVVEGARCEVTDGLQAGERLVVNGMNYLADGMNVEVVRIEDIR